ncbi:MAG: prepilin-type N-terminal cleavage/methylation domain-containing protein [Armatimonadetes bacterium]|nr:prepilin-type N-terminal cleavage/methylation domain-containing protein [Armatimonadota bacterium]
MQPMIGKPKRKCGGFTMVEVLLVILVLSFSALIFAAAFPSAQISRIKAVHMSYAMGLAQQTIEEKRSAGYANLLDGTSEVSVPAELPGAQQTTTIEDFGANIKKIDVTITWGGYRMVGGTVHMSTLISDHS